MLNADDLLAGSALVTEVEIPSTLLAPEAANDRRVRLKPLSVQDLRLIHRAARENDNLTAALMVQRALVEPELTVQQINVLSAGLLQFLLHQVNRISGIGISNAELAEASRDPMTRATLDLARDYGWTPQQIGELTLGQILLHLQDARVGEASRDTPNR